MQTAFSSGLVRRPLAPLPHLPRAPAPASRPPDGCGLALRACLAPGDGERTTACWQRGSRGSRSEGLEVSTQEDLHEATTAENYHLSLTSLGRETHFLLVPVLR